MEYSIKRGDVYFIERDGEETGSEQRAGRPAIVVSNNVQNLTSDVVQVVYLTTRPKNDLPTHVTIRSTGMLSTALCEQVTSIDVSRLGDWKCQCTQTEMEAINQALLISLGLEIKQPAKSVVSWKDMYDNLLNKILERG